MPDHRPGVRVASPPPRTSWSTTFPDVVVHTTERLRNAHPDYLSAKAGRLEAPDSRAALRLALDVLDPQAVSGLQRLARGGEPILLPVTALEATGVNTIPDAVAQILAETLDWPVSLGDVIQTNRVGHTRARAFNRLVTPAEFEGPVSPGADYVLVDDHVGLGGTLANLKGYLETRGARVIAMTTLTESRDARQIALRPDLLNVLRGAHGEDLETFWRRQFGHGLDCLTNIEAGLLRRQPSVEAIRDLLATAALEARERGLAPWIEDDRGA